LTGDLYSRLAFGYELIGSYGPEAQRFFPLFVDLKMKDTGYRLATGDYRLAASD
jgi:hypothetical protein